jgi:hypothetical protein
LSVYQHRLVKLIHIVGLLPYVLFPPSWLQIKFASVKLAKMYMKRVAMELQYMGPLNKDPALEYMLLQAVRFAFRMHQVTNLLLNKFISLITGREPTVFVKSACSSAFKYSSFFAVCWRFRSGDHGCIRGAEEPRSRQKQHPVARTRHRNVVFEEED